MEIIKIDRDYLGKIQIGTLQEDNTWHYEDLPRIIKTRKDIEQFIKALFYGKEYTLHYGEGGYFIE